MNSPLLNVLLFSLFWAFQIFISKLALSSESEIVSFSLQSTFVALLVLGIYVLPKWLNKIKSLPKPLLGQIYLANIVHSGFGAFLSYAGIAYTTAINAGFLAKFSTVATIFFAWLILGERLTKSKMASAFIMLVGVYLMTTRGQRIVPHFGDTLILLSCVAFALGNVLVRRVLRENEVDGDIVSFLRPLAGIPAFLLFIALSPLYPESLRQIFDVSVFSLENAHLVLLNGLFVALLTIYLNRTLKVASASYLTLMSMITPIIVSLLAFSILNESIQFIQAMGALLIIVSGFVVHYMKVDQH